MNLLKIPPHSLMLMGKSFTQLGEAGNILGGGWGVAIQWNYSVFFPNSSEAQNTLSIPQTRRRPPTFPLMGQGLCPSTQQIGPKSGNLEMKIKRKYIKLILVRKDKNEDTKALLDLERSLQYLLGCRLLERLRLPPMKLLSEMAMGVIHIVSLVILVVACFCI